MNNTPTANLIAARGNRCTASILGWMEKNIYSNLSEDQRRQVRQVVLDNVNAFKDLAIDIVKSDAAYVNEFWAEKLDRIHDEVRALRHAKPG